MSDTHHIQVFVEDGTKAKEEYGVNRKVNVTLSSDIGNADEIETLTTKLADLANAQVARLLSRPAPVAAGHSDEAAPGEAQAPTATRKRRTQAEIAADKAAEEAAKGGPQTSTGDGAKPTSADAAAITDGDAEPKAPAANAADITDFDAPIEGEGEAEEITDADLNAAATKKNAEIQDPAAVRALIKTYAPDPTKTFQLSQIPQADRPGFLAKLADLKKAG